MLRIPHPREIGALFYQPHSVAGATKALTDTAKRLDGVMAHHNTVATKKNLLAGEMRSTAAVLEDQVASHQREAGRAANVASKLEALLS